MVEGRFSLGSDWLIIVPRALPLLAFIHRRALYQYVVLSRLMCRGLWSGPISLIVGPISLIVDYHDMLCVSWCPLAWCLVSHDGLTHLRTYDLVC